MLPYLQTIKLVYYTLHLTINALEKTSFNTKSTRFLFFWDDSFLADRHWWMNQDVNPQSDADAQFRYDM